LFNIKLRKLKKKKNILIISFSSTVNILYYVKHLGVNLKNFLNFLEGKHYLTNYIINKVDDSLNLSSFFMLGSSILRRKDSSAFLDALSYYIINYNKKASYGIVQTNIGRITSAEIGISKGISYYNNNSSLYSMQNINLFKNSLKYTFFYACDDYRNIFNSYEKKNIFNIYVGAQGFDLINYMNIVLPATHHFEKETYYLNLEGIVRKGTEIIKLLEQAQYD